MVSCPRLVRYELLVIDFAKRLLDYHSESVLNKRSSIEKDMADLKNPKISYEESTLLKHNINLKRILMEHKKFLTVLKAILGRF